MNLPAQTGNNEPITYSVVEEEIIDSTGHTITNNYVRNYGKSDSGIYLVNNREGTALTVSKEWYDRLNNNVLSGEILAQQSNVTFDLYRTTAKISEEIADGGITNAEMTAFLGGLTPVRENLTFGSADEWSTTISDLEKYYTTSSGKNNYYYYVLESVPSFGDEIYEVNEENGTILIKNKTAPETKMLTVSKAALVGDNRTGQEFTFTLTLEKDGRKIRGYQVYSNGDTTLVTGSDGTTTRPFTLTPESSIVLTVPVGVSATVTEAFNPEYTVQTTVGSSAPVDGRSYTYVVSDNNSVTFTNTLHVICKVVDSQGVHPFWSLNSALAYINSNEFSDTSATIQMLED